MHYRVEDDHRQRAVDEPERPEEDEERDQRQDDREHLHDEQRARIGRDEAATETRQRVAGERRRGGAGDRASRRGDDRIPEIAPEIGALGEIGIVRRRQVMRQQRGALHQLVGRLERVHHHEDDGQVHDEHDDREDAKAGPALRRRRIGIGHGQRSFWRRSRKTTRIIRMISVTKDVAEPSPTSLRPKV